MRFLDQATSDELFMAATEFELHRDAFTAAVIGRTAMEAYLQDVQSAEPDNRPPLPRAIKSAHDCFHMTAKERFGHINGYRLGVISAMRVLIFQGSPYREDGTIEISCERFGDTGAVRSFNRRIRDTFPAYQPIATLDEHIDLMRKSSKKLIAVNSYLESLLGNKSP